MINIQITVPVFYRNSWGQFDRKSEIQISSDVDVFSEGYAFLRAQIDELLQQSGSESQMLLKLDDLEKHISSREKALQSLDKRIEVASGQLQRLQNFLERLGIDPTSYSLLIANAPIGLKSVEVVNEVENNPIPFNSSGDDDDDDDDDDDGNSHEF